MKKFRKVLALLLVLVMVGSMVGCGKDKTTKTSTNDGDKTEESTASDDSKTDDTKDAKAEESTAPAETEIPENTISGDENVDKPFYVYSWNTEIGDRLEYFKKAYPEYAKRIIYVNTGGTDFYQSKIDPLLDTPDNKQYPDMIGLEADYILKYVNSDYTLPITKLGITQDDLKNQYPYTYKISTDTNGEIKGLSWQAAPGAMMYRRSLAKKYLGTDDPAKVQEYFKDWNTMLDTGRKIVKDSGGKTKLFSGNDDVQRVFMAARTQPWVKDDVLTIDDRMMEYLEFNKALEQENLTNKTTQWTTEWTSNVNNDNTFAYMGCTWFLHWTLKANCGCIVDGKVDESKKKDSTYGDWAMCQGPNQYYWGGTWLSATKDCSDPELAGLIMKFMTTDTDNMKKICEETLDYVNNREAVKQLIAEGKGTFDFVGGQDFLSMFSELADKVDVSTMSAEDFNINSAWNTQVSEYATGKKTKDEAVAAFKSSVTDMYNYITAQD